MATNDLLVGYTRRFAGPVDATATFATLTALQTYATNDATAYAGQVCAVTGTNTVYVINSDKSVSAIGSGSGVSSFNTRTGAVTLTSNDVTLAVGYTPANTTSIPTKTSQLTNDSGYLTSLLVTSVAGKTGAVTLATGDISGLKGLATLSSVPDSLVTGLATVATSGSYNDLSNKPVIPAAQVNSDWNATLGVASIANKPIIPTKTSQLTNDSGYLTSLLVTSVAGKTGAVTLGTADISGFSAAAASAAPVQSVFGRIGNITLTSGDVTNALGYTPAQSTVAGAAVAPASLTPQAVGSSNQTGTSAYAAHADHIHAAPPASLISGLGILAALSSVPISLISGLATVATTGSYSDLTGKPTIPAAQVNADWNAASGVAAILNKPTIPTSTSQLTNNSGFITLAPVTSVAGKTGAVTLSANNISGLGTMALANDAPDTLNQYVRIAGAWQTFNGGISPVGVPINGGFANTVYPDTIIVDGGTP